MYFDIEVTPKEQEEIIQKIAKTIHKYGLDVAAILIFESVKPLSYMGSQMGRLFLSPFLPAISKDVGIGGEKLFQIMEKQENVEKLIEAVEKLTQGEEERKKAEKVKLAEEGELERKGWRRFIPF